MLCKNCGEKVFANEVCVCGEKAPKKNSGGVAVNSVICFIVLIISAICLIITLSLRTIVNRDMLIKAVNKADLSKIEVDDGMLLNEYIYNTYVNDERITIENIDNILSDTFIKEFLIDKIYAYQDFVMDNGELPYITSDEIIKLIDDNANLLFDEAGLRFLDPDKEQLRDDLSELKDFENFSQKYIDTSFGTKLVQTFFSYANIIFLSALIIIILIQWIVVYKANSRRAAKVFNKYGAAVATPASIMFLGLLVFFLLIKFVPEYNAVNVLLSSSIIPFILYSAAVMLYGDIFIIISAVLNKKYKEGRNAKETSVNLSDESIKEISAAESFNSGEEASTITSGTEKNTLGICSQCGHQNKSTSVFCSRCGNKLK